MAEAGEKKYETQDLGARAVRLFAAGLAVLAVFTLLAMAGVLRLFSRGDIEMAVKAPRPGEPPAAAEPRLQISPARDLQEMRALEDEQLHGYGWVDRQAGIAAIPIERAMELIAQRGLAVRRGDTKAGRDDKERR
jgi:hypothetical protein